MQKFLEPESVILIGAPRKTGLGSYNGVEMMLRYGYKGRIYPILTRKTKDQTTMGSQTQVRKICPLGTEDIQYCLSPIWAKLIEKSATWTLQSII